MNARPNIPGLAATGDAALARAQALHAATGPHEYAAADGVRTFQRNCRVIAMHSTLRMLFLQALQHSDAASTPLVPTTFLVNEADEGEQNRFEPRLRMQPVTAVAASLSDRQVFFERVLAVMRAGFANATDAQRSQAIHEMNDELAEAYADAYADDLVSIGWELQS